MREIGWNESWWVCPVCGHIVYHIRHGVVHDDPCGICDKDVDWIKFVLGEVVCHDECIVSESCSDLQALLASFGG